MKKFSEQFKAKAEHIRLREDEQHELRQRLLSYMEYHPLPQSDGLRNRNTLPMSISGGVFLKYLSKGHIWGKAVGLASVFLLVIVPVMAEDALPGETLYPVKVRFNEELRGALASSPYQKIEWETERLERRVSEANLLADSGRLTPAVEAGVAVAIKQHSDAAKKSIDSIRVNDESEAAFAEIALVSALEVSAEMLMNKDTQTQASSSSTLSSAVNEAKASMVIGEDIPSYDKLMARLEIETTRAYEYLGSLSDSISSDTYSDIESRLGDVRAKIDDAAKLKDEDELAAAKLLVEALNSTGKVTSFMTNLNVRNNVLIENLVPAALSREERKVALTSRLEELDIEIVNIQAAIDTLATSSVDYQNLTEEIDERHPLRASIDTAIEADNLASAEKSLVALVELVAKLSNSIKILGIEI